jgi:hypothetical protein
MQVQQEQMGLEERGLGTCCILAHLLISDVTSGLKALSYGSGMVVAACRSHLAGPDWPRNEVTMHVLRPFLTY